MVFASTARAVGADGATHAGAYDIPFVRCIPTWPWPAPPTSARCRQLLSAMAFAQNHPVAYAIRAALASRGALAWLDALPYGKGEIRRSREGRAEGSGARIAILAFGTLLYPALGRAGPDATVVNMRWAKPLDVDLLLEVAASHDALVTVEEGA